MAIRNIKNHRNACRYFWPELDGKNPEGIVLHHKDPTLKENDPERYDEWRPEDLVPMKREDHQRLHLELRWSDPARHTEVGESLKKWHELNPDAYKGENSPMYGKRHSEESKKLQSEKAIKRFSDPEERKRHSQICSQAFNTPEIKSMRSEIMTKRFENLEERKKAAERTKSLWQDEEFASKVSASIKIAKSSPEARKHQSEITKSLWQDKEYKEKIRSCHKGTHQYNNGIKNVYAKECPGPEWKEGWIPRRK